MTLLTKGIRYYLKCSYGHRFERAKPDSLIWCPKCGGKVWCYGLKDSTHYDPDDIPTGLSEEENSPDGS